VGPLAKHIAIADSGATFHFVTANAPNVKKKIANPLLATIKPNGVIIYSMPAAKLDLPHLPPFA
jgi:membrane protease subunit (stomatin/prohibitin family)